jgi:hypothetical protein
MDQMRKDAEAKLEHFAFLDPRGAFESLQAESEGRRGLVSLRLVDGCSQAGAIERGQEFRRSVEDAKREARRLVRERDWEALPAALDRWDEAMEPWRQMEFAAQERDRREERHMEVAVCLRRKRIEAESAGSLERTTRAVTAVTECGGRDRAAGNGRRSSPPSSTKGKEKGGGDSDDGPGEQLKALGGFHSSRRRSAQKPRLVGPIVTEYLDGLRPEPAESFPARGAVRYELAEGERLEGVVRRLPRPGTPWGNRLFLSAVSSETPWGREAVFAINATAKHGHVVLERELARLKVRVGDRITVAYLGKRNTLDGARTYRDYQIAVQR